MSDVSTKPYLLRAIYEWCVDQGLTPYLAVMCDASVRVPASAIRDNQVVLNLSPTATERLQMGNELITCNARFGGKPFPLSVPVTNVLAIYARENGQGMAFEVASPQEADESELGDSDTVHETTSHEETSASAEHSDEHNEGGEDDTPPRGGGRPHLKVVK